MAHGFLPGERALAARDFSGGEATVGRLLRGLGFTVQVDELSANTLVRLLTRLNVFYSDGLPALYQSPSRCCGQSAVQAVSERLHHELASGT